MNQVKQLRWVADDGQFPRLLPQSGVTLSVSPPARCFCAMLKIVADS